MKHIGISTKRSQLKDEKSFLKRRRLFVRSTSLTFTLHYPQIGHKSQKLVRISIGLNYSGNQTVKVNIALTKWLILPIILLASCSKESPLIIPDHLKDIEEVKIIEHVFYPDTTKTEREDIYTYEYKNRTLSESLSHKWVITSYDDNDSLIRTSFFKESLEYPISTTQFSYSPFRKSTKYLFNEVGDTIQIEKEKYGPDGILTQEFQNLEGEAPTYFSYNFSYKGGLVDSFAIAFKQESELILNSYEKRYYNQKNEYDSIIFHEVDEKETSKWKFDRSNPQTVYVINTEHNDTLMTDKYYEGQLTQRIVFNFYERDIYEFDESGRVVTQKAIAKDTLIHFYQYYLDRTLEFIYTK